MNETITTKKLFVVVLLICAILFGGEFVSLLLRQYCHEPFARGLGFFLVCLVAYLAFKSKTRINLWQGIGLSAIVALIEMIGKIVWPN